MSDAILQVSILLNSAEAAFSRRDFTESIDLCNQALAAKPSPTESTHAERLKRHAEHSKQLSEIALEDDPDMALTLIDAAINEGLEFDLEMTDLRALRSQKSSERSQAATMQALGLIAEAESAENQGDYSLAETHYREAVFVLNLDAETKRLAEVGLQRIITLQRNREEFNQAVQDAKNLQAQSLYAEALAKIKEVIDQHPELVSPQIESTINALDALEAQANQAKEFFQQAKLEADEGQLETALSKVRTAKGIARRLGLDLLQNQIDELENQLLTRLGQREQDVQNKLDQAESALSDGDWERVADFLNQVRNIDPSNNRLISLQEQMTSNRQAQELVAGIVAEAARLNNPRDAMLKYAEALRYSPSDLELTELVEIKRREYAGQAAAATRAELDLGFETPQEVIAGRRGPDGSVLVEGTVQLLEELDKLQAEPLVDAYQESFSRIAAAKLSQYIELHCKPLEQQGKYPQAVSVYEQALKDWSAPWLENKTMRLISDDGTFINYPIPSSALKARREIVTRQRDLAVDASQLFPTIDDYRQQGAQADRDKRFSDSIRYYRQALQAAQPDDLENPGLRKVLAGVAETTGRDLASALLHRAAQLQQDLEDAIAHAQTLSGLDESLDEALDWGSKAHLLASETSRLFDEFSHLSSWLPRLVWTINDRFEIAKNTYEYVNELRHARTYLENGRQAMSNGEYGEANDFLSSVPIQTRWGREAQERLKRLPQLIILKTEFEDARINGKYESAIKRLNQIIGLDGRSTWAHSERDALLPQVARQREAQRQVNLARLAYKNRNFDAARRYARHVLDNLDAQQIEAEKILLNSEQMLALKVTAEETRSTMLHALQRGESLDDFLLAMEKATELLKANPEDLSAQRVKFEVQAVLDMNTLIQKRLDTEDLVGARDELEKFRLSSKYINNLRRQVSQRLSKKLSYEDLCSRGTLAYEQERWIDVLLLTSQTLQRFPSADTPREQAREAREVLTEQILTQLRPPMIVTSQSLSDAEAAYQAMINASMLLTEPDVVLPETDLDMLTMHLDETNQAVKAVENWIMRARRLMNARRYLAAGDATQAFDELKDLASNRVGDAEVQELFSLVSFRFNFRQGLACIHAQPPDYATAVQHLTAAVGLIKTELENERSQVQGWLDKARLEAGLKSSEDALQQGEKPEAARIHLAGLPSTESRVEASLTMLDQLEENLKQAKLFFKNDDDSLSQALNALDSARQLRPGYSPVENLRVQILEYALQQADEAVGRGSSDYGTARRFYHLVHTRGSDRIRERGLQGETLISEHIEKLFRQVLLDTDTALGNPDLGKNEAEEIEKRLMHARTIDPERQAKTLAARIEEIRLRIEEITKVENLLDLARAELDKALLIDTFDQATKHFNQCKKNLDLATNTGHYSARDRVRQLRNEYNLHSSNRALVEGKGKNADKSWEDIFSTKPTQLLNHSTLQVDQLESIKNELTHRLKAIIDLLTEQLKLDPNNQYRLREWNSGQPLEDDTVRQRVCFLEKQLQSLNNTTETLKNAIYLRSKGSVLEREAKEKKDIASSDEELQQAIELHKLSTDLFSQAINGLQAIDEIPAKSIPELVKLYELRKPLLQDCQHAVDRLYKSQVDLTSTLEEILRLRSDADRNYNNREYNIKDATYARDLFQQIKTKNPNDADVNSRIEDLNRAIAKHHRRSSQLKVGGVISGVIFILTVLGILAFRPGGALNTTTSSPTQKPSSTPQPTDTATLAPSPTLTFTAQPTPTATIIPTHTDMPRIAETTCSVIYSTWLYESAGSGATGKTRAQPGMELIIVNALQGDDNFIWYEVLDPLGGSENRFVSSVVCKAQQK